MSEATFLALHPAVQGILILAAAWVAVTIISRAL